MRILALHLSLLISLLTFSHAQEAGIIKNVDAPAAMALLKDKSKPLSVLDIRTPEEFQSGHIKGATMVDFKAADFESKLGKLDKEKTYLVHCRSGGRSTASLEAFKKLGFKSVIHLDGGMLAWLKAGGAVEKP